VIQYCLPAAIVVLSLGTASASLAQLSCGNDAAGFDAWKGEFAQFAAANGVGEAGLGALANAGYDQRTINKDRNQTGVRYALDDFLAIRWSDAYTNQARRMLADNADFFAGLQASYGVPPEVLLAILGMESGFGANMGDHNTVNSILTVAYDCRRADFFIPHAVAALMLVDYGVMSPGSIGAAHGEIGQTQFLPGNVLTYARDGNGDGRVDMTGFADAMASTANYLAKKGWQPGQGYQEGQPNFAVIEEWNAATVYQQAIALLALRIAS
jgi:membrane-bound lytic murein transglycosylase B